MREACVEIDSDGGFTVALDGPPLRGHPEIGGASVLGTLPHLVAAAVFRLLNRPQRTPHEGGAIEMAHTVLSSALNRLDDDRRPSDLITALEDARLHGIARGAASRVYLLPHLLDHDRDLGVERPRGAGHASVCEPSDDLLLARVMAAHGVGRIARVAEGVRSFHGGMDRIADNIAASIPYVTYRGLPPDMPAFMVQRASAEDPAMVLIGFGFDADDLPAGALYQSIAGRESIGVSTIPESVAAALPGHAATDLVGHPALEGYRIGDLRSHPGWNRHEFDLIRP